MGNQALVNVGILGKDPRIRAQDGGDKRFIIRIFLLILQQLVAVELKLQLRLFAQVLGDEYHPDVVEQLQGTIVLGSIHFHSLGVFFHRKGEHFVLSGTDFDMVRLAEFTIDFPHAVQFGKREGEVALELRHIVVVVQQDSNGRLLVAPRAPRLLEVSL